VLGYGTMILAMALEGGAALQGSPTSANALNAVGRGVHAVGVTLFLGFVLRVFRPREAWARGLALALAAALWTGFTAAALTPGGFALDHVGSWYWWAEYAVIWSYPLCLPSALSSDAAALAAATPSIRIGTALAGLASVTCSLFAFLPPRWYRERVQTRARLEPASA
jgi:hypothetical protein